MKIVSSGRVINSRGFYEKKKRRKRVKLILLSLLFLSFLSSLVYLSRQKDFLITEVVVLGENIIGKEKIVEVTKHALTGYYLWVIPRASAFVYPRRTIQRNLTEAFPRFKSIDLDLDKFRTLFITVEERSPFALYCISDSECFFLDEEGLIFVSAPSFSGASVYFIYRTSNPIESPLGKRLMETESFKLLIKFIEALETLSISFSMLEIGEDEYGLSLSSDGQIIWRRDSDLDLIRSNLEAFFSSDAIQSQKDFLDRILYLDLRTEDKVFYKFRD